MALLNKADLLRTYSWTAMSGDDPRVSGLPDSTLLNRHEGYEVLYFINTMASVHGLTAKADGLKIERMLAAVPPNLRSRENVKIWIEQNWPNY
jgi:hypothetical protein